MCVLLSLLFIAAATLTPGSPATSASVPACFWCALCSDTAGADAAVNVWLFVPLGAALALGGLQMSRAVVLGCVASCAIEASQHFGWPVGRVASVGDVITNSCGTLMGAFLATHRATWLRPTPRVAARLSFAYATALALLFVCSAWALGRDYDAPTRPIRSTLSFTPGFGWFHGKILTAAYDSAPFSHTSDGPVIVSAAATRVVSARVTVAGVDGRPGFVPLLYVHAATANEAHVMIGERAGDAELQVQLRARRLKLAQPALVLANAFSAVGDSVRELRAEVSSSNWRLFEQHGSTERSHSLTLTLSTAFTLFQTVVQLWEPSGVFVMLCSLPLLFVPLGYFVSQTFGAHRAAAMTTATAVELQTSPLPVRDAALSASALVVGALALWLAPLAGPIAPTSLAEFLRAGAGVMAGAAVGMLALRRSRVHTTTSQISAYTDSSPTPAAR